MSRDRLPACLWWPEASATILARILARVRIDPETGCWEWLGAYSKKRRGYRPHMKLGGGGRRRRTEIVARVVCRIWHGPPEEGQEAGHTCPVRENAKCIRPEHLRWMTRAENEQQKARYRDRAWDEQERTS